MVNNSKKMMDKQNIEIIGLIKCAYTGIGISIKSLNGARLIVIVKMNTNPV